MARTSLYRITDRRFESEAFSGKGGLYAAGRWHELGRLVVYAALTSSLALLEWRVHTRALPRERTFVLIEASAPAENLIRLDPGRLPADWRQTPPPPATHRIGEDFLAGGAALGLIVPSVVNLLEYNVVLNPVHPSIRDVRIQQSAVLQADPRLFGDG